MDEVAYYIRGLLRQPNAHLARTYLGITGAGGGGAAISAGAQSQNTGTVIFANSNNITFGLNAGTLTASFAAGAGGSINFSAGITSANLASVTFSNANGITFGLNAGVITASHNGITIFPRLDQVLNPTVDKVFAMPANVGLQFQYAAGASFTTNATRKGMFEIDVIGNATDGADVMHVHQSVANPNLHLLHLEAAGTGVTLLDLDAAASIAAEINAPLKFTGGSVPMILGTSQSNVVSNLNAFYLEGARSTQFLTSQSNQAASASNGSFTFQTLNFSNASNVTFGTSAGGIIFASVAAQSIQSINVSAGTVSNNLTELRFSNFGNVAFGMNGSTITAFATPPFLSAGTLLTSYQTYRFLDSHGITFGMSGNEITASHNALTSSSQLNQAVSAANGSFSFQTLSFANSNGVSFSTGTQGLFASISPGGAAAIRGIQAGASTATENTVNFSNSNGISFGFGTAGNSTVITASHNALTAVAASASNGSFTFSTLNFSNANNVTFGTSAGGIVTASVNAGGAGVTISHYDPPWAYQGMVVTAIGAGLQYFQPFIVQENVYASRINFYFSYSGALLASNSTGTCGMAMGYGLYTRAMTGAASGTLSLLTSYTATIISLSHSSNTQLRGTHYIGLSDITSHSTSQFGLSTSNATTYLANSLNGQRVVALPMNLTLTPGQYWLGFAASSVTGNAMTNAYSIYVATSGAQPDIRPFGVSSAASNASVFRRLQGAGTAASSAAFPNSIAFTTNAIQALTNLTMVHFDLRGYGTSTNIL